MVLCVTSEMMTSVSQLVWTRSLSVERLMVPLIPTRQCSLMCSNTCRPRLSWNKTSPTQVINRPTDWVSPKAEFCGVPVFTVEDRLIQQMSSHLLNPHALKRDRPTSSPDRAKSDQSNARGAPDPQELVYSMYIVCVNM